MSRPAAAGDRWEPRSRDGTVRDRRPALMVDVARLAGVSNQTVSRVLHGHPLVSVTTRARVEAAMDELHYRPNRAARTLATGRAQLIGVVTASRTFTGPSSILLHLQDAADRAGYALSQVGLTNCDATALHHAIEVLLDVGVDAIVILAPTAAEPFVPPPTASVPLLVVQGSEETGVVTVGLDDSAAAGTAVRHLLDLGHRQVWHVGGPANWWEARQRAHGWARELRRDGIVAPPVLTGDWTAPSGYSAGRQLAADPDVTAVFVANDEMAAGVLAALRAAGRAVPGEVSVIGFDDHPVAGFLDPPLTTVRTDVSHIGHRIMSLLASAWDADGDATVADPPTAVPAELVVRSSTGPASRHRSRKAAGQQDEDSHSA